MSNNSTVANPKAPKNAKKFPGMEDAKKRVLRSARKQEEVKDSEINKMAGELISGEPYVDVTGPPRKRANTNKDKPLADKVDEENSEMLPSNEKAKNEKPKKTVPKAQPLKADDASPNEENLPIEEDSEHVSSDKKPKNAKITKKVKIPQSTNAAEGKSKKAKPNVKAQLAQTLNSADGDEDLVVTATTKDQKNQEPQMTELSSAADFSPNEEKTAIDEDADVVLTEGNSVKPNEKVQIPETLNYSADISSDDELETPKINKTDQTEDVPKNTASYEKGKKVVKPINQSILQLKIALRGITPSVWRRIQVLNTATFYDLNNCIQKAMGWRSYHCQHFFVLDKKRKMKFLIADKDTFLDGSTSDSEDVGSLEQRTTTLSMFLKAKGDRVVYEYDFGDSWMHNITVEKVLRPLSSDAEYPKYIGGARACPPEDCGGFSGYQELLEVYRNPNHPQYEELIVNWLELNYPGFDPEKFNTE